MEVMEVHYNGACLAGAEQRHDRRLRDSAGWDGMGMGDETSTFSGVDLCDDMCVISE
jgi:hypothetical protein